MNDIPYSTLKENKRSFEILTLRDQYGNTFADIAKEYGISAIRTRDLYNKIKRQQIRLYVRHIAVVLGHSSTAVIKEEAHTAYRCYQDIPYVCTYLEKRYRQILDEYRAGEAGLPERVIRSLPPLKRRLRKKTVSRIVEMRETERATFAAIGRELDLTQEKVRHTYNMFYTQKVWAYINARQQEARSADERQAIWYRYFGTRLSPQRLYEMIRRGEEPPLRSQ